MKKIRVLSVLAMMIACVMSLSLTSYAYETTIEESGNSRYNIYQQNGFVYADIPYADGSYSVVVLDYVGSSSSITIPTYLGGHKVKGIYMTGPYDLNVNYSGVNVDFSKPAFYQKQTLQEVVIPEGIEAIAAFEDCKNLTKFTVTDNVNIYASFKDCPNVTIYCNSGSNAHSFATSENIPYVLLDAPASTDSDVPADTDTENNTDVSSTVSSDSDISSAASSIANVSSATSSNADVSSVTSSNTNVSSDNGTSSNTSSTSASSTGSVSSPKTGSETPVFAIMLACTVSAAAVLGLSKRKENN